MSGVLARLPGSPSMSTVTPAIVIPVCDTGEPDDPMWRSCALKNPGVAEIEWGSFPVAVRHAARVESSPSGELVRPPVTANWPPVVTMSL